jgi:hypothetical protein
VPVGQPAQQRLDLTRRFGVVVGRRRGQGQRVGQGQGPGVHLRVVLDRGPHVAEHPLQVGGQLRGLVRPGQRAHLQVDPRLFDLVVGGRRPVGHPEHAVHRAADVPDHPQLRVDDLVHLQAAPVHRHQHRVHQVGHVVGDDVHGGPGRLQRGRPGGPYPDQGPALRPERGERGLPHGYRRGPLGPGLGQVLGGHVPVVGVKEAGYVTDAGVGACRLRGLGQQGFLTAGDVRHLGESSSRRAAPLRPLQPISQVPQQWVIPQRDPLVKVGSAGRAAGS